MILLRHLHWEAGLQGADVQVTQNLSGGESTMLSRSCRRDLGLGVLGEREKRRSLQEGMESVHVQNVLYCIVL